MFDIKLLYTYSYQINSFISFNFFYFDTLFLLSNLYFNLLKIFLLLKYESSITRNELLTYNISSTLLLFSDINNIIKLLLLLFNFNNLTLYSNSYTNQLTLSFKLFIIYIYFIYFKYYNSYNFLYLIPYSIIFFTEVKWYINYFYKLNYNSYTSIFLSLPLHFNKFNLKYKDIISFLNMVIASEINHLYKNKLTNSIDCFFITYTSLNLLNYSFYIIIFISFISFFSKNIYNNDYINKFIYLYAIFYFSIRVNYIFLNSILVFLGFALYMKYKISLLWHLSNGVNLLLISNYLYDNIN